MKILYVAGPFRGPTPWDVECNVRHAEALSLRAAKCGVFPFCPHANTRFFDKQCTDELWLNGDLELLHRCDGILLTNDYVRSTGARAELEWAVKWGLRVFHENDVGLDEELRVWGTDSK